MSYDHRKIDAFEELKHCKRFDTEPAKTILKLFPEFEESDFMIKKRLENYLCYFRSRGADPYVCDRILKWLDNQDTPKSEENKPDFLDKLRSLLNNARKQGRITIRVAEIEDTFPELEEYGDELAWVKNYLYSELNTLSTDIRDDEDVAKVEQLKKALVYLEWLSEKSYWDEKTIAGVFEKVGLAKIVREQKNDDLTRALEAAMIELAKQNNSK